MSVTLLPTRRERLRAELAQWSQHPSAYLALNQGTEAFRVPGEPGFVAYRERGGWWFQLGSVFAPPECQGELLQAFRRAARTRRKRVCALQLRPDDVALYRSAGFRLNQLGTSYALELSGFTTRGSQFVRLRNKVNRARKAGVEVVELGVDAPRTPDAWRELETVTKKWLIAKGKNARLLEFMIGEPGQPTETDRRVFVARQGGEPVGFVSYVPSYGATPGYLHDLSRRVASAPPGVMELLNVTAIQRVRDEGAPVLHFGLTPLAGLSPETDGLPGRSRLVSWSMRFLARHGDAIYPARSQARYKEKWGPGIVTPEYFAFEGRYRLSCLWRLLQLTRTV